MQERVLYFDTDSVIYIQRPWDPLLHPPRGNFLGYFKNELAPNDPIVEFCSGCPKNYGYQTKQGKVVCKVHGFSLNVQGSAQLNYHVLRTNTLHELHDPLSRPRITRVHQSHTIHRNCKSYTLETRPTHKDYKMVYTKRVLEPGTVRTYPFGYRHSEEEEEGQIITVDDVDLDNIERLMDLFD